MSQNKLDGLDRSSTAAAESRWQRSLVSVFSASAILRYLRPSFHPHRRRSCRLHDQKDPRLVTPPADGDAAANAAYINTLSRYVAIKEEQAHLAKTELLVLWTDYFKPPHLEQYPNLHDTFWKAAKACSAVKVEVSAQHAEEKN